MHPFHSILPFVIQLYFNVLDSTFLTNSQRCGHLGHQWILKNASHWHCPSMRVELSEKVSELGKLLVFNT